MYGEAAVLGRACQKWFVQFRAGDFSLEDAPGSGRPGEVDSDPTETLRTTSVLPHRTEPTHSKHPNITRPGAYGRQPTEVSLSLSCPLFVKINEKNVLG